MNRTSRRDRTTLVLAMLAGLAGGWLGSRVFDGGHPALAAGEGGAAQSLKVSRLELVDGTGAVLATLGSSGDTPYLFMTGRDGKRRITLSAGEDQTYIAVNDGGGKGYAQIQVQKQGGGNVACADRDGEFSAGMPHLYGAVVKFDQYGLGETFSCEQHGACRLYNVQNAAASDVNKQKVMDMLKLLADGKMVSVLSTGDQDAEGRKICKVRLPDGSDLSKLMVRFTSMKDGYREGVLPPPAETPVIKPVKLRPRVRLPND